VEFPADHRECSADGLAGAPDGTGVTCREPNGSSVPRHASHFTPAFDLAM
jgi:hypothetical protein